MSFKKIEKRHTKKCNIRNKKRRHNYRSSKYLKNKNNTITNCMPINLKTYKMDKFLGEEILTSEEVESLHSSMPIKVIGTVV